MQSSDNFPYQPPLLRLCSTSFRFCFVFVSVPILGIRLPFLFSLPFLFFLPFLFRSLMLLRLALYGWSSLSVSSSFLSSVEGDPLHFTVRHSTPSSFFFHHHFIAFSSPFLRLFLTFFFIPSLSPSLSSFLLSSPFNSLLFSLPLFPFSYIYSLLSFLSYVYSAYLSNFPLPSLLPFYYLFFSSLLPLPHFFSFQYFLFTFFLFPLCFICFLLGLYQSLPPFHFYFFLSRSFLPLSLVIVFCIAFYHHLLREEPSRMAC